MITDAIARELHARSLVSYLPDAAGGDCFIEDMPSAPAAAVAIYSRGGLPADSKLGYDEPSIQVMVRGATADARVPAARAAAIYAALCGLHATALPDGTQLVSCLADQSSPVSLGPDDNGRHRYSLNFTLDVRALTTHRT